MRDFLPFVAAILLYENLRGVAHSLRPEPFYMPMIDVDRFLAFGHVPSVVLQDWLWTGSVQWYDQVLAVVARAHFFVPPTLLFLIWLERRELFYRAVVALVGVSLVGALVFLVFPAAPPWRASEVGLLPDLVKIGTAQAAASPVDATRSFISNMELPNPYAAVPSLHTAYSLLTFVFAFAWRPAHRLGVPRLPARHVVHDRLLRRSLRRRHHRRRRHGPRRVVGRRPPRPPRRSPRAAGRALPVAARIGPHLRRSEALTPRTEHQTNPRSARACTRRPAAWRCLRAEARRGRVPALRRRRLPRPPR